MISFYTHVYMNSGRLVYCSEAKDFMHYYEDGSDPDYTGFGFCEHEEDTGGAPKSVLVPWPDETLEEMLQKIVDGKFYFNEDL